MTPISSLPGVTLLLAVTFAAASGMAITAREIEEIWRLRLDTLTAGTATLGRGGSLCTRLKSQRESSGNDAVRCLKKVELRVEGIWKDGCELDIQKLNPPRFARLSSNCTWQMGGHNLRLPAVEIILKR